MHCGGPYTVLILKPDVRFWECLSLSLTLSMCVCVCVYVREKGEKEKS